MFNTTQTIIPPSESMVLIYTITSYVLFIVGLFITLYSIRRMWLDKKQDPLNFKGEDTEDDDET